MESYFLSIIFFKISHTNNGDLMNYLENIQKEFANFDDLVIKNITIQNNNLTILSIDTIVNSFNINDFILKKLTKLSITENLSSFLINNIPCNNVKKINFNEIETYLMNAFTIIIINNQEFIAIETIGDLNRGISSSEYEKTITGPKDSFIEHFNTNVGLIRKRIRSHDLKLESLTLGKYTNTKIGIMYVNTICKPEIKDEIISKLKRINIDGIIDSGYLKKYLTKSNSLFPTIKSTERPDLASQALLEGKIVIITDNSPDILILPSFFIDYFHMSDDYYQKHFNITFIRIVRLFAFLMAILLPAYYIAITTFNVDFIPINLLVNFISQRSNVPFPAFIEAFIMIISFEILRESDMRIPSSQGTAISILGGLVLGDAAVQAGIISPIMIIVVAISAISGLVFQSVEVVNAIRFWRFILIILSSLLGLYGIFLGIILIIINLSDTHSMDKDYLYPFAPINFHEQKDGFIRTNEKKNFRNPLISNNHVRGENK